MRGDVPGGRECHRRGDGARLREMHTVPRRVPGGHATVCARRGGVDASGTRTRRRAAIVVGGAGRGARASGARPCGAAGPSRARRRRCADAASTSRCAPGGARARGEGRTRRSYRGRARARRGRRPRRRRAPLLRMSRWSARRRPRRGPPRAVLDVAARARRAPRAARRAPVGYCSSITFGSRKALSSSSDSRCFSFMVEPQAEAPGGAVKLASRGGRRCAVESRVEAGGHPVDRGD